MFNLNVTPEFLSYLAAGLLSILFDWLPGLAAWFDGVSELKKKQIIAALLLVIVLALYGGICSQIFSTAYTCDKAGFASLFEVLLISVGINQGIHALTKPTMVYKLAHVNTGKAQGMVEYALILVLVAVVVIAAVTVARCSAPSTPVYSAWMTLDRFIEIVLAALGGGTLAALVSFYRARAQNGLDQAQAWKTLLEQMQSRLLEQQKEIDSLALEIAEKDGYIQKVIRLLDKAGMEIPTYVFRHRYKVKKEE
jgi:Flp pilus assembly pilin Flp